MRQTTDNLQGIHLYNKSKKLDERLAYFDQAFKAMGKLTYKRTVLTAADREVSICDPFTNKERRMLMFASNNYLGLANHPFVLQSVKKSIDEYGVGIGGPPLLNGYSKLVEETESRLAAFKNAEAALVFSSGFMANLAIITSLAEQGDTVIYDELSHASFYDALKMSRAKAVSFKHNDLADLEKVLTEYGNSNGSTFLCTEGVYSMDGDIAPLDKIAKLANEYGAIVVVDDAHGTGVLGENGNGTAAHLNCEDDVDIGMGTFSKVFATCGGFITASASLVQYMRYFARQYVFSASIPPPVAASVIAGLQVIESEPWIRKTLLQNVQYAISKLEPFGFYAKPEAAIITLALPEKMNIRKAALLFHEMNIFINPVEYPAVPAGRQRFRISMMATHTTQDIDRLATAVEEVWNNPMAYNY